MIKYSVIIPVYNSEKTIKRCLDSLLLQNRKDIQIVVVNDGSTDASDNIITQYASKHAQIEYIRQNNMGVSCARNAGINAAKGRYITFLDSDDYVLQGYFGNLDAAEDTDLLVFAHENTGGMPLEEAALFQRLEKAASFEERLKMLLASRKIMSPCNKRFKTQIIRSEEILFLPNMNTGEDFNFCMAYVVNCKTISILSEKILCVDVSNYQSLSRGYRDNLDIKLKHVFFSVSSTIKESSLHEDLKENLLAITDYLFVKHSFSCILEEFKTGKFHFIKDRRKIAKICKTFEITLTKQRYNTLHIILRLLLRLHLYFLLYFVAWVKLEYNLKYH